MSEQLVSLKNARAIPMLIPNGYGGMVELAPGETKEILGDFQRYKKMVQVGLTGLVVKAVEGKGRLVEEKAKRDLMRVLITNHRQIPVIVALGGGSSITIHPGETREAKGRVSVIKQLTGLSVRAVGEVKKVVVPLPPPPKTSPKPASIPQVSAPQAPSEGAGLQREIHEPTPPPPPPDIKASLQLPQTVEEFKKHAPDFTMADLRGIAARLGFKSRNRGALVSGIAQEIYGSEA